MDFFSYHVDEFDFLQLFKSEMLPVDFSFQPDDILFICVQSKVCSVVKILSDKCPFFISNIKLFSEKNRIPFNFSKEIINEICPLSQSQGLSLLEQCEKKVSDLHHYLTNIDDLILTAERKKLRKTVKPNKEPLNMKNDIRNENLTKKSNKHLSTQQILKEIGHIIEVDTYIARNDRNKIVGRELLSASSLKTFPKHQFVNDSLNKRFSLIDTIWFKDDTPLAFFEVETSTSIYSGILRMADYYCTINDPTIRLYLVVPKSRLQKAFQEVNRPVFQHVGLSDVCRIITIEELEILYNLIKPLKGYIKEDVLEKIVHSVNEFQEII